MSSGLYETTEETMVLAHQAGMAYWKRNKPTTTNPADIEFLARTLHWHGADNYAFVAGYFGAKSRDKI